MSKTKVKGGSDQPNLIRPTPLLRYLLGIVGGAAIVGGVLFAFAEAMRRERPAAAAVPTPADIAAGHALRSVDFDPAKPVVLQVDVTEPQREQVAAACPGGRALPAAEADRLVREGQLPAWYPRGEAPVLADLVKEGALPPVAERVGPEPVVMRGVEGVGRYGGTWLRVATTPNDISIITWRLSGSTLLRWSPYGYPIKPHLARSVEVLNGARTFVITLRRGVRYSDGVELTSDDILYWWNDEVNEETLGGVVPDFMMQEGRPATVEKLDRYRVRIAFAEPNGLFREALAHFSYGMVESPEHYLRPYHPRLGDPARIEAAKRAFKINSSRALYFHMKHFQNTECPRLWPWIYRTYTAVPPQVFVRNPYYFVVDEQGNQLPYVDRVQFDVQDPKLIALSAANGKITMQARHIQFQDYTELASRAAESGTRILHWYSASRSVYAINPNLNRRVDPKRPETKWKARLLGEPRFRQALSLGINRAAIIRAEYGDCVEPSQVEPGRASPFHSEKLAKAFIEYDPARASRMLDALWRELGGDPAQRDREGFRVFPDGTHMAFFLDFCAFTGIGPAQFVVDDWARIGMRVIPRERSRSLFYTEKAANNFDFNVWSSESDYLPVVCPRYFVAANGESFYAGGWGRWFALGGFYGNPQAERTKLAIPVPRDHPMYRAMTLYEQARRATTIQDQNAIFQHVLDLAATNLWTINISTAPPQPVVVKQDFRNVPKNALCGYIFLTPANAGIETYYFTDAQDSPGAIADTREAIRRTRPEPGGGAAPGPPSAGRRLGRVIRWAFLVLAVLGVVMAAVRHPYIGRRLALMVPTLLIISASAFVIIQLPPGDYLSARLMQLQEAGDSAEVEKQQIEELRRMFHFDEPGVQRYARWMGLYWFRTFDKADEGLLQGNLGRSMETQREINAMVGDRILLTIAISLGTIVFTWLLALPIGIFSACRQYSLADYVFTFVGFLGMCIPPFLLALILMAISNTSGLFSAEFAAQPEWSWPKFLDLLRHIWIPIVVMGVGGTAGMIRVMRANLLDELKKPYVITAMAKGVRPLKLLLKYPVRLALNPFISGIGGLFPQLISGGTIVAMVLALPTVGPLMLGALFSQDMYLAGSMLMVLSLLGVVGTLVSDLLLLWLDPRIRFKGGTR